MCLHLALAGAELIWYNRIKRVLYYYCSNCQLVEEAFVVVAAVKVVLERKQVALQDHWQSRSLAAADYCFGAAASPLRYSMPDHLWPHTRLWRSDCCLDYLGPSAAHIAAAACRQPVARKPNDFADGELFAVVEDAVEASYVAHAVAAAAAEIAALDFAAASTFPSYNLSLRQVCG